jgi:primosomal protein N'
MAKKPEQQEPVSESLKEGVDYYLEKGRYVFTAYFLQKRGYCCQNGCRHCPYRKEKKDKN